MKIGITFKARSRFGTGRPSAGNAPIDDLAMTGRVFDTASFTEAIFP